MTQREEAKIIYQLYNSYPTKRQFFEVVKRTLPKRFYDDTIELFWELIDVTWEERG
jgi:hypothetical protein